LFISELVKVKFGELFAFLGPNSAGKSTCINILCTLLKFEEGSIYINGLRLGRDDNLIRQQIGIAFQNGVLDNVLSVRENLYCRGSMYGLSKREINNRINSINEIIDLESFIDRKYERLSGGQKRRADLARALLNPKIMFLDEPTTGLDPSTRKELWTAIKKLQGESDLTVFLTTHYLEEAENANRIVVINDGRIVEEGTPSELKQKLHLFFILSILLGQLPGSDRYRIG